MRTRYKILILIAVLLLAGVGIYFGWELLTTPQEKPNKIGGGPTPATSTPSATTTREVVAPSQDLKLIKLSDHQVFDYWIYGDVKEVYYLTPEGTVWNAKAGDDLEISKQAIKALNSIELSPKGEKILVAFQDPRAPQWAIFDVIDQVWRPLPAEIQLATWGSDSNRLVAVRKNASEFNLVEMDISKSPPVYKTLIRDFRFKDVAFASRPPHSLIITEKPSAVYAGRVWELDLEKLTIYLLHAADFGLTTKWVRGSSYVLKFASPDRFSILNQSLQEVVPVFFTTLPDKCGVAEDTIYCFVPQELPANITLPDDYFRGKFYSIDDLFEIRAQSGAAQKILSSNGGAVPALDGENPYYLNGVLYFMNRYDKQLYSLTLTKS